MIGGRQVPTCNVTNDDDDDDGELCAIPFHSTCLEVFKRASLERYGACDVKSFGRVRLANNTVLPGFEYQKGGLRGGVAMPLATTRLTRSMVSTHGIVSPNFHIFYTRALAVTNNDQQ